MSTSTPTGTTAVVNGEPYDLGTTAGAAVSDVVAHVLPRHVADGVPRGVAVAIDDAVVPRGAWGATVVRPGDRVEVVTAVQGG